MSFTKKQIRMKICDYRKNLSEKDYLVKSEKIYNKIVNSKWYLESDTIISYVSAKKEPDTINLIKKAYKDGKKVAVPKVVNNEMEFYYISSLDELCDGYYGILEPVDTSNLCIPENVNAIMLVPGVAFDLNNNRTGYGGGFYDRYLSNHTVYKIAICFKEQIFEELPVEDFDIKMDEIITD